MNNTTDTRISKSDFLLYCEAPRHLWAKKNGRIELSLSDFDQHLIDQGYQVEGLAREYLDTVLLPQNPGQKLLWQQTFCDGPFEARLDVLIYKPETDTDDLYEIKSSTALDKENLYDVAYQASILKNQINIDHFYLLHLDKEYIRSGELDLARLFVSDDVTDKVNNLLPEIELLRWEALRAAQALDPDSLAHCLTPNDCPCPDVCHPSLPEFSIYDIPRLGQKKKIELLKMGIREAKDIPVSFDLNQKQRLVADRARTKSVYLDRFSLQSEMERVEYPIYFLDYETCISAIPQYDGYHPQQQVVFQYSLHRMDKPGGEVSHTGHVSITSDDPSLSLLEQLRADIGKVGTVIVWNKTFEMTMNKEMAKIHPEYAPFLMDVNARIYDLGEIVNQGYYLHPGFKGSWSIKNVLPVMVPELSYDGLAINKGDQASMAWWNIVFGNLDQSEKEQIVERLEKYCELDTLAMVNIFKIFETILHP